MFGLHKRTLKKICREVESKIWVYTQGKWNPSYFLRHILCFLRQHPELCEQSDYKELYDETVTLLILHAHAESSWTIDHPTDQQGWIELLADLQNKNADENFEFFNIKIIDEYLIYRKIMWDRGEKHTKAHYGFIS